MRYRFIVKGWTNAPIETEIALEKAIDLHAPLIGMEMRAIGHEPAIPMNPEDFSKDPGGDPWHFIVEGETNSPAWALKEIAKAIRNHDGTSTLGLEVGPGHTVTASSEEREDTVEDIEQWLRNQHPRKASKSPYFSFLAKKRSRRIAIEPFFSAR